MHDIELQEVSVGTFESLIDNPPIRAWMVSVAEFSYEKENLVVSHEYLGLPMGINGQKIMLNLLKFRYQSMGFRMAIYSDNPTFKQYDVFRGDGLNAAFITAIGAPGKETKGD